jgi:flagellar biosynthesis protein FliP
MKKSSAWLFFAGFIALGIALFAKSALAQGMTLPTVNLGYKTVNDPQELVTNIKILLALTVLTLAPAILIMMTSFTRIIIVLSFVRQALGTQNMPPNQLLVGLALFITLFIMSPFITKINSEAIQPFLSNTIKQDEAIEKTLAPIRGFMFNQTRDSDLALFVNLSKSPQPKTRADVSTMVLIPACPLS